MTLYRVAGRSMLPSLLPGQLVIARRGRAKVGDIVVAHTPHRLIVKRVAALDSQKVRLIGDNHLESTDSQELGDFPTSVIPGVVILRYPILPTDPPQPIRKGLLIVPYVLAGVLLAMLLAQLTSFEIFVPLLQRTIGGDSASASWLASLIVVAEMGALPFLLRLRLSPLARAISAVLLCLGPLLWIMTLALPGSVVQNCGMFGQYPVSSKAGVALALVLVTLAGGSFVILRGHTVFDLSAYRATARRQ